MACSICCSESVNLMPAHYRRNLDLSFLLDCAVLRVFQQGRTSIHVLENMNIVVVKPQV